MVRSIWFIGLEIYVLDNNFERKKLILYEDEITILSQICDGKTYQKEVKGFSENTVYRKLKAARERNGNISKEQLIEPFILPSQYAQVFEYKISKEELKKLITS